MRNRDEGTVLASLSNATFRVKLENDHDVTAGIGTHMRKSYIRVITGDTVLVSLTVEDLNSGTIIRRFS